MNFTNNLKRLRLDSLISQEQLAKKIGVSKRKIVEWESGISYPQTQEYVAISNVFNIDIDYLLNGKMDYTTNRLSSKARKKTKTSRKFRKKRRNLIIIRLIILAILFSGCYKVYLKISSYYSSLNESSQEEIINMNYTEVQQEYIDQLSEMKNEMPQVNSIMKNIKSYPTEVLDLLIGNHETVDFVSDYLNRHEYEGKINISKDYKKGKMPLFIQWDKRWGYDRYGNNIIAINGCGPTSLSMVAVSLTGDTSLNPKVIADYSESQGFIESEAGTSWLLMSKGAEHFGLKSSEVILDKAAITKELKNGRPIIASVKPGDFTTTGHFIVLRGIASNGKVLINDPNSIEKSNKEWDLSTVMPQISNLWSFSK